MSDDEQAGSRDVPGEALFELAQLPLIVEVDPMAPTSGR